MSTTQVPPLGRSLEYTQKVRWALLPSETASQCDSGSGQDLTHSCLYQLLQSLGVSSPNRSAQVLVILEPCGQQACVPHGVPPLTTQSHPSQVAVGKAEAQKERLGPEQSETLHIDLLLLLNSNSYSEVTVDSQTNEENKIPCALYPTPPQT